MRIKHEHGQGFKQSVKKSIARRAGSINLPAWLSAVGSAAAVYHNLRGVLSDPEGDVEVPEGVAVEALQELLDTSMMD